MSLPGTYPFPRVPLTSRPDGPLTALDDYYKAEIEVFFHTVKGDRVTAQPSNGPPSSCGIVGRVVVGRRGRCRLVVLLVHGLSRWMRGDTVTALRSTSWQRSSELLWHEELLRWSGAESKPVDG